MPQLLSFAVALQIAMVAVGAYGSDALQSLRFAAARLLVAISLGVIFISLMFFAVARADALAIELALRDGASRSAA